MDNDAARHEFEDVLALVQEQMTDLAAVQQKQAALTATAEAAEGTIEVTVDARGVVIKTVVDETYLQDFEFAELGGYVTTAVQAAAAEVGRRAAELMGPLSERRQAFPSLSEVVEGAPDLGSLVDGVVAGLGPDSVGAPRNDTGDGWEEPPPVYPTVRR